MADRGQGLYYNRARAELLAVFEDEQSPGSSGWEKLSDNPWTGLLPARRILVRNGVSEEEATKAYWRPTKTSTLSQQVMDEHIRKFKRATAAAQERADRESPGIFARLRNLFFGYGRGDAGTKPLI